MKSIIDTFSSKAERRVPGSFWKGWPLRFSDADVTLDWIWDALDEVDVFHTGELIWG